MNKEDSKTLRKMAKGGGILFLGAISTKAIMYFYRVFVAQELGPAVYGLLMQALAVYFIFVGLSNNGAASWVNRNVSKYIGKEQEENIPSILNTALLFFVPLSVFFAIVLFYSAESIATRFFGDADLAIALKILAFAIPFEVIYNHGSAMTKAFQEMKYITYIDKLYRSLVTLIATLIFVYLGLDLEGLAYAQTIAIVTSGLLMIYLAHTKIYPFLNKTLEFSREEAASLFNYSYPIYLSGIVSRSSNWIDTLLLGFFSASASVGVYNAAMPTASLLTLFSSQMSNVLFPTVSEYYGKGKKQKAIEFASISLKWIYFFTFPGLFLMILFSTQILDLLFGSQYTGGALALSFLGIAYFMSAMTRHAGSFINTEEQTQFTLYNSVAISGLNVILNILLIPGHTFGPIVIPALGVTGAAVATAISTTLGSILAAVETYIFFDVQPYKPSRFLPSTLATLISGGITYIVLHILFEVVTKIILIPGLALFGTLYILLYILLGGVSEKDSEIIESVDDRLGTNLAKIIEIVEEFSIL